jgi:hypothetical protein
MTNAEAMKRIEKMKSVSIEGERVWLTRGDIFLFSAERAVAAAVKVLGSEATVSRIEAVIGNGGHFQTEDIVSALKRLGLQVVA